MKNIILILIQVFIITVASAQSTKVIYTCVMHPEVQMSNPGKCPKCGMTLVKKTIKVAAPKPAPQKQSEKPKTKEPVTAPQAKDTTPVPQKETETKVVYTCVMHPQIQMDKPGKCPICGMTLVKKSIPVKGGDADSTTTTEDTEDKEETDASTESSVNLLAGKTVVYHLYVRDTVVNFTGKMRHAIAINGSIPAPTLTFTEGDTAEIYLHNMLDE